MNHAVIPALLAAAVVATACASKPEPSTQPLVPYTCNGSPANLTVDYKANSLDLHIGDKITTLKRLAPDDGFETGPQYSTSQSRQPKAGNLVWKMTSAPDVAYLYEIATRPDGTSYEKQLANCTSKPKPLNESAPNLAPIPTGTPLPGTIPGTVPGTLFAPQQTTI